MVYTCALCDRFFESLKELNIHQAHCKIKQVVINRTHSGNGSVEVGLAWSREEVSQKVIFKIPFKYLHQIESYIISLINTDLKKYFNSGSKKPDLSSEISTSGDNPKKIRDGSLDDSNNPDDGFTEGLSSPECVKILYNY